MSRLLFLGILIYALLVMGLILLTGTLLALAIPILVLIGASLLFGPEEPQLSIERRLSSDRSSQDTPVQVTLTVTNNGSRIEVIHIFDAPPRRLEVVDGEIELLTSLDSGESAELHYEVQGKRGRYDFGKVHIVSADLFGLLQRETFVEAPGLFEFFIYPEVMRIERIPIRPRQTKVYAGYIPARVSGSGVEFFNVRNYQTGDQLRHINWRANARHPDTFFTNEFEQERVADVGIILDARQSSNVELAGEALFEYGIVAAAALADSFLNDGNRVALLRYGDFLDWTVPGYGKFQRERILRGLSRAQTGNSLIFDQLEYLPARLFPPKSQLVLVSPLASGDVEFLKRLRARGYHLLIVSPDPVAFELELLENDPILETAARLARLERELLFQQLRQVGIQICSWQVSIPFAQAIGSALVHLRPGSERNLGIVPQ